MSSESRIAGCKLSSVLFMCLLVSPKGDEQVLPNPAALPAETTCVFFALFVWPPVNATGLIIQSLTISKGDYSRSGIGLELCRAVASDRVTAPVLLCGVPGPCWKNGRMLTSLEHHRAGAALYGNAPAWWCGELVSGFEPALSAIG